jgi:RhtB (resistance to homoserine/threonine) family protein
MEYLPIILTVAIAHFLAVVSPGPDFLMITRNSLIYSRRTGIYSAIGLGFGILVHIIYSLIGIGLLIAQSVLLFNVIKFLGAGYLIYIGYKSLTSKSTLINLSSGEHKKDISSLAALKMGFITNVTNPKATLFFLSLFTVIVTPNTPLFVKLIMGAEMMVVTSAWFVLVSYMMSHNQIKSRISKVQGFAEKFIGIILIGLGIKVALSTSK